MQEIKFFNYFYSLKILYSILFNNASFNTTMMHKNNLFIITACAIVLFACNNSKHPLDRVPELKAGYRISTEKGWKVPADTVSMSEEQVLKLYSFDEAALNMNEFMFYAQKKITFR